MTYNVFGGKLNLAQSPKVLCMWVNACPVCWLGKTSAAVSDKVDAISWVCWCQTRGAFPRRSTA